MGGTEYIGKPCFLIDVWVGLTRVLMVHTGRSHLLNMNEIFMSRLVRNVRVIPVDWV